MSIESKESVDFEYPDESLNDFAFTSFTFIGQEDLIIGNKKYPSAYKFMKKKGRINTVTSQVYFDRNFIIIKEEFVTGERPYYRMERIDTVLNFKIN